MLHVHAARPYYIYMLHAFVACPCCMFMLFRLHVLSDSYRSANIRIVIASDSYRLTIWGVLASFRYRSRNIIIVFALRR
jgi:hypothetical protein